MELLFQRKYRRMSFFISLGIIVIGLFLLFISDHKLSLKNIVEKSISITKNTEAPPMPETAQTKKFLYLKKVPQVQPPPTTEPPKTQEPTFYDRVTAIVGWVSSLLGGLNILLLYLDRRRERKQKDRELFLKEKELELRSN